MELEDKEYSIPGHPDVGLKLFSNPLKSFSHWLAHFLIIEPTKIGTFKRNGVLWVGHQCTKCGKISNAKEWNKI
jgi:hypothetical protein